jgi:hypothetical protein
MQTIAIGEDVTFGFFEDVESDDPKAEYEIRYLKVNGEVATRVRNPDIRRMRRRDSHCIITVELASFTGFPEPGRRIDLTAGRSTHTFLTNMMGVARFPTVQGARVKISIDEEMKALDVIIPAKQEAHWEDLVAAGSWIDIDQRGWY